MELYFFLDPIESLRGPLKPAFLLAMVHKQKFETVFASQSIDKKVARDLKSLGFGLDTFAKQFFFKGSFRLAEAWLRKSEVKLQNKNRLVVNCSQCFLADANIYYGQGPMSKALDEIYPDMRPFYRLSYWLMGRYLSRNDRAFIKGLRKKSQFFVANSNYCAGMYEELGVHVDKIIYPPLDCDQFKPSTLNPSRNYVLTYFGKETKYDIIKSIANKGVKIRAFGSRNQDIPSCIRRHKNIEIEGKVSDNELVDLYSNAAFTLFTFNHEPFGYIPVESMACGTPVLSYNRQGPSETIINQETGWLVDSDSELISQAAKLWKTAPSEDWRSKCRVRALMFDKNIVAQKWLKLFEEFGNLPKQFTAEVQSEPLLVHATL
jgi:glycosyltransferase involved in cell wall biosynthesis